MKALRNPFKRSRATPAPVVTLTQSIQLASHWPTHPSLCPERQQAVFHCKRTRRRGSVALKVTPERLTFLVPNTLSERQLQTTFKNHQAWLFSSLDQQLQRLAHQQQNQFQLKIDQPFALLGQTWHWQLQASDTAKIQVRSEVNADKRQWTVTAPADTVAEIEQALQAMPHAIPDPLKRAFRNLCQSQLEHWLAEQLPKRAAQIGVQPTEWQVKHYRARWGSCDHKGRVRFHWAIALMPETIADYVLVHELCHLIHFDHSSNFWQQVVSHYPEYRQAERWLKQEGAGLMWV
jgi:predicted metal-dependent hydrolase